MKNGKLIHLPPDELKVMHDRQRAAVDLARPALARLVAVMTHKTGQGYKLRALLWSMWNGKPASLNDVCGLDYELRADLGAVILAWGYEPKGGAFFYNAMEAEVRQAGLWDWFVDERLNIEEMREYVRAAERERPYDIE